MRAIAFGLLLWTGLAIAEDEPPMQRIEVSAPGGDEKSYRRMLKGLQAFEEHKALAPNANLRFRIYATNSRVKLEDLNLRLMGDKTDLPLKLDAKRSFALPLDETAKSEDADLRANRRPGNIFWKPYVETPGLPPDTRRLGDLRVQCKATFASGLEHGFSLIKYVIDGCTSKLSTFAFFADGELFSATVRDGAREFPLLSAQMPNTALSVDPSLKNRTYAPPLKDLSLSDDTLVELHYVDSPGQPVSQRGTVFDEVLDQLVPGQTRRDALPALDGKPRERSMGEGHMLVWTKARRYSGTSVYDVAELALYFDKEGVLRKQQVRSARIDGDTGFTF